MNRQDMYDLSNWRKVGCAEYEEKLSAAFERDEISVHSSLTDLAGTYGRPQMFTEWGEKSGDKALFRNYIDYNDDLSIEECRHYERAEEA